MGRIMAIDYGHKRVGLAVSDQQRIIATSLTTVLTKNLFEFLDSYLVNEQVDEFVVGLAKQMDNTLSESSVYIEPFVEELAKKYPDKKIIRIDERFSSKIATQTILQSGAKKKQRQNKALVDTVSAVILLQSYMK
ncbi:MAG: Holliday junction resolvase RuvX [Bacteroidales bacterium]|jgi:putative Holliday junction resolvase|nr:Holliday junction resolvase RuvX [Bacteroidales bacterium]MDD4529785.1 Holliday junction resolvase RuvX [Bacteroidales bacterium]MDD4829929.1 Holliday junction resolvase RuvX [Bacteroidales bacterium]